MKGAILLSALMICQLNISFTLAEVFQIYRRRPQGHSGWQNGIDYFGIPSSLCGSPDYECSVFNAKNVAQNCSCTCPVEKSTFTWFESQWSCIENSEIRTNLQSQQYSKPGEKACEQEMESLFVNEYSNSSLRVLKPGDEKAISILNNWKSCEFDSNHSWYFGCSDSRLSSRLYLETMINLFTLTKGDYYYHLKVGSNVLNTHLLTGRIINLGIYCRNASATQTQRGCLLFKLEGNVTCPITKTELPGTSTPQPNIYSKKEETVSPTQTSSTRHVKTGTKPIHPSASVTLSPSSSFVTSPPITSVAQSNVSSHVPSSRPNPDDSKRSSGDVSSISVWLVSGLIVSTLFIVIIVGFLIARRSNSRKKSNTVTMTRSQETQNSAVMNQHTNSAFQTDEQHGYFTLNSREPAVYASMYQVPMIDRRTSFNEISNPLEQDPNTGHVYDALNFPEGHSIYGSKNATELPTLPPKKPAVDNATKFQNYGQISIEQLVYNIVEEILAGGYERPIDDRPKQTEPVYNVLEPEPHHDASEGPSQYDDVTVKEPEPSHEASGEPNQYDDVTVKEPDLRHDTSEESSQYDDVTVQEPEPSRETSGEPSQYDDVTAEGPIYSTLEELNTTSSSAIDC